MTKSEPSIQEHERSIEVASQLRVVVARFAWLLRQQDDSGFGPTLSGALSTIAQRGPITLGDLAERERLAKPTVTRLIERLEGAGYVARKFDPNDKRVCMVVATPSGKRHLERVRGRRTAWLAERLADLSSEEIEQLENAVQVLERMSRPFGEGR